MKRILIAVLISGLSLGAMAKGNGNSNPPDNVWAQLEALQAQVDALSAGSPPASASVSVDCGAGETITDALATPAGTLNITYSGVCNEDVEVDRDGVNLFGAAGTINGSLEVLSGAELHMEDITITNSAKTGLGMGPGATVLATRLNVSNAGTSGIINTGGSLVCVDCISSNNTDVGIWVGAGGRLILAGDIEANDNGTDGISIADSSSLITALEPAELGASNNFNEIEASRNAGTGMLIFGGSNVRFGAADDIKIEQNANGLLAATGGTAHLFGTYRINNNNSVGLGMFGAVGFFNATMETNGNGFGVFIDDHGALRGTPGSLNSTDNRNWSVFVRSGFLGDVAITASNAANGDRAMLLFMGAIVNLPGANVSGSVVCDGTELINGPFFCGFN